MDLKKVTIGKKRQYFNLKKLKNKGQVKGLEQVILEKLAPEEKQSSVNQKWLNMTQNS